MKKRDRLMRIEPAVDQVRDRDGGEDAEHRADGGDPGVPARIDRRPDEQGRLDALAADAEESEDDDPGCRTDEGDVELGLQVVLEPAGVVAHPEDHPGDERDGEDRQRAAEDLLGLEAQSVRAPGEDRADAERERNRDADADPESREHVAPPELLQVGHEDADDEAGFEAFTQADEKVCEHAESDGASGRDGK